MRKVVPVFIKSGAASSEWIDAEEARVNDRGNYCLAGIATPATVDVTTIQVDFSLDASAVLSVTDTSGNAKTITQTANKYIILAPADYSVIPRYFRLTLGTNAGGDRVYNVVMRSVD